MDVSVIMINYNTFDLTKDAIESIFSQTDGIAYEIILVDNLSPDGSGERLRDLFGERIVYLQSGGNLGTSKAFNLGISRATGKYVLWLNTDIWRHTPNAGSAAETCLILRETPRTRSARCFPVCARSGGTRAFCSPS